MTTRRPAPLHDLGEPVGLGHLVLDQVLAQLDGELEERRSFISMSEVLNAVDEGMAGRLVAVQV
jgi:hypothetical protein